MDKLRPYSNVIKCLRNAGLRPTRQRLGLAKLLFEGDNQHVTAEMLHRKAVKTGLSVSLATVYNVLHQFNKVGLLHEIVVEAGRSYFDTNTTYHHHIFDEDSRELKDIEADQVKLTGLPEIPAGQEFSRIDIILRVKNTN